MIYGYARVSTDSQSLSAQVTALRAAGAERVLREVASGARTDRARLRETLAALDEGDVLMVTRLDRLARSTRDLLNTLAAIAASKAGFRSLGDAWADTTTAPGRLMLTVLGGLAEFERDLIRARTGAGREPAVARGVKMGRKPKLTPHQQRSGEMRGWLRSDSPFTIIGGAQMTDLIWASGPVRHEYERWVSLIGMADPYVGRLTIGIHEVLQAHFLLVDYFGKTGEGLGGIGPKDINLLHSALNRQFVQFGGTPKWNDAVDICATLMFGLIKNHPFHDANKRTAFLTSILHLQKIGRTPTVSHTEYEDFTVAVADNKLGDYEFYDRFSGSSPDREISVMAHFLKRSTRNIDLKSQTITYNVLNTILNSRGLRLENPKGSRIDLVRYRGTDGETEIGTPKRIAHIGFHGWSKQVSQKDINIAREASRLDARHGYDSQSFFSGLDDPLTLIKKYKEPLERLAFR